MNKQEQTIFLFMQHELQERDEFDNEQKSIIF